MKEAFHRKSLFLLFLIIVQVMILPVGYSQQPPFTKGVNLAYWFEAESSQKIKFTQYTRKDFENIKSLGCDVIRIPIHLPNMSAGEPDYTLDPLFFSLLDQVVAWAEDMGLYLILDNHSSGDIGTVTDPGVGEPLKKMWSQMAEHYKHSSTLIMYEILNEPHDIDNDIWNTTQQEVLETIRDIDTIHTVVLSPANWDNFRNLDSMYVYNDDHVLYTFHFYEPHLFTSQGTSNSNFADASGVPFPYSAEKMPPCPGEYIGTWKEQYWGTYNVLGTVDSVRNLMNLAVNFASERNVKVFCGEFGSPASDCPADDRIFWYQTLRSSFEEKNISWLIWDYHSDMGIFTRGDYYGLFEHDLNIPLVTALGFNVPAQTPLIITPDETGFDIYKDYVSPFVKERSYTAGDLNFYSEDGVFEGDYCINWSGGAQYNSMVFGFNPFKDLSLLVENDYVLSFRVKGNDPNGSFQLRFLDTKTSEPGDHPWRRSKILNNSMVQWDNNWQQVTIPLSEFTESGSWDDNIWYNPEGKFDWTAIDQFEIATEQMVMGEHSYRFDDISIKPKETGTTGIKNESAPETGISLHYRDAEKSFELINQSEKTRYYDLIDLNGRSWKSGVLGQRAVIQTDRLPKGLYFFRITDENSCFVKKVVIL